MEYLCSLILGLLGVCGLHASKIPEDLQKAKFITVSEKNDGFGSQLHRRMSAIAFAEYHNKTYVHLPYKEMQHNYENNIDYPRQLELFSNIGLGSPLREDLEENDIYEREDYRYYTDENIDAYYNKKVFQLFKNNYYSTSKPCIPYFDENYINVAVHIRRGDVTNTGPMGRWMCDEHYLSAMQRIRKEHKKVFFHVFSEGNKDQFVKFWAKDVQFHLNGDIEETFHALVIADILLTSKSAFSYSAALLSEGIIYYTKCWLPKLSHWYEVESIILKRKN